MASEDYSDLIAAAKSHQAEDYSDLIAAAGPEEGGPESFLDPKKFKPSPIHRKLKNTGPIEQVRADLEESRQATKPMTAEEAFAAPVASAIDRLTGGGYGAAFRLDQAIADNPIARAVDASPLGPYIGKRGGAVADANLQGIERYRQQHPTLAATTDIPGYLAGAPKAFATTVEEALPRAIGPLQRAIGGSALTSAALSGSEAAGRGEEPADIARDTGEGFIGGATVAAPLSIGSSLLGRAAKGVLGSKGAQAREYLESRGQPLTAKDTSDSAIGAAAMRGDEAVKARLGKYKGEVAAGPYMEAINAVPEELANQPVNMTPVYRDLQMAANDPANLQVADKLQMLVKMLGDRPIMTQQDANGLRRALAGIAGVGETTAGKLAPLRRAYDQVKAIVDQGPYAEANRRFASGMDDFNNSLDMVGLRSTSNPDEPIAGNLRVKLQRAGQNTVTAGGDTEALDLEAFKAKHPDLADSIDAAEILRRQGDLGFHLFPQHGGLIERVGPGAALAAHALGAGATGIVPALAYTNWPAIAGRVLYGPAQEAQLAAGLLLGQTPQLAGPGREVIQEGR